MFQTNKNTEPSYMWKGEWFAVIRQQLVVQMCLCKTL